eukprot:Gb_21484 [translate_table: standard]
MRKSNAASPTTMATMAPVLSFFDAFFFLGLPMGDNVGEPDEGDGDGNSGMH